MTFRERLANEHPECIAIKYFGGCKGCPSDYGYENDLALDDFCESGIEGDEHCRDCWDREMEEEKMASVDDLKKHFEDEKEAVNHPSHYNREGSMECIDEMILVFGRSAVSNFCLCNAWKYRYRASAKNGEEDLKKSDWYLAKYKELQDYRNDIPF